MSSSAPATADAAATVNPSAAATTINPFPPTITVNPFTPVATNTIMTTSVAQQLYTLPTSLAEAFNALTVAIYQIQH
jgi:hypothetical protein